MKNETMLARGAMVLAAVLLPVAAQAHKAWLLPSQTVLSQKGFITVDAAVSNDLFYFNHQPLRTDDVTVTAPDGSSVQLQNVARGRYRSTFDLDLQQEGTYRIVSGAGSVQVSWEENGQTKNWRGAESQMAANVPKDAKNVQVRGSNRRIETFVTVGKPSDNTKPSGKGLELVMLTHPNDLYAGEAAKFQFVLDGKPAANVSMEVVAGGSRYRDSQGEMKITTDKDGKFQITWPEAGMYWLEASATDPSAPARPQPVAGAVPAAGAGGPPAGAAGPGGPGGPGAGGGGRGNRAASYIGTFEVLSQ